MKKKGKVPVQYAWVVRAGSLPPTPAPLAEPGGEGARSRPGPPVHLEQVLLLSLECLHILTKHNIYAFYTERTKQVYNVLL